MVRNINYQKARLSINPRIVKHLFSSCFLSKAYSSHLLPFLIMLILLVACQPQTKESPASALPEQINPSGDGNVRLIFFNMYLPTEMSRLFEKAGVNYDPSFMNPADNISRYNSPHNIAVNLGIYGVDLNYARIFNQTKLVAKYISSIKILAGKLGIPHDYYEDLLKNFEKYYGDKDSLTKITSDIYTKTDEFLKLDKKDSYAALIVMGGWVEALYIASKIYEADPINIEIMERIAEQKYSLNSLIALLSNYQDDITIAGYILMLKTLKKSFDQFEIFYKPENLRFDTSSNRILTTGYETGISTEIISEINLVISSIRAEFVM